MFQLFNFVMSALNDPLAAGTQMAMEGVSPDMLGTAMSPQSQQTLATMIQPKNVSMRPNQPFEFDTSQKAPIPRVEKGQLPPARGMFNPFSRGLEAQPQTPFPNQPTKKQLQGPYTQNQNEIQNEQIMQTGAGADQIRNEFRSALMQGIPERNIPGLSNPNAIAAVMATGEHESGFSPNNVFGKWSDPSESGQPGTAGGALSWRAERFNNLLAYGGGKTPPPSYKQAQFFLEENPQLVAQLEAASSPEEATMLMNNAWKFAGYDQSGGEAANRINTARNFAMSGDAFLPGGDIATAQPPDMTPSASGDQRFTTADITAGEAPQGKPALTRAQKLAQKIAQIGKGLKVPEQREKEAPRMTGGLGPQVGGNYSPAEMGQLFALLGGQPQQNAIPPLSQLIRGVQ